MSWDPIALALPVFGVAILVEAGWRAKQGRPLDVRDAIASMATGVAQRALLLLVAAPLAWPYAALYAYRAVDLPAVVAWPLGLVAVDLSFYAWHRWTHENQFGWASHVVHHQSEHYNLAVALRQSSTEPLTSLPFALPWAMLGVPLDVFVACGAVNLAYQFFLHTELVPGPSGVLGRVFNTPSHHRVHHGIQQAYLDRNYGGMFIVFDHLFGTFEPEGETPRYGTLRAARTWDPVVANLQSFVDLWREARGARGAERWGAFVHGPSWRPSHLPPRPTPEEVLATRVTFAPRGGEGLMAYVGVHFLAVALLLGLAMAQGESWSLPARVVVAAHLVLAGVTFGRIFEGRPFLGLEALRLATAGFAAVWFGGPLVGGLAGVAGLVSARVLVVQRRKDDQLGRKRATMTLPQAIHSTAPSASDGP